MLRRRQSAGERVLSAGAESESGSLIRAAATLHSAPAYEGATTGIHEDAITGWAWDANRPYEPVDVELYVDDVRVGQRSADMFDVELAKANRGNGMHRFEVRLDRLPAKSPPFIIRIIVAGTDVELLPPIAIATLGEAERLLSGNDYIGEVTEIADGAVCGWVVNRRNPHDAPVLTLRDGDREVASQRATERTTQVLESGVTATAFRFELALPHSLLDGKLHSLTVFAGAPAGRALGSPFLFGASDMTSIARMLISVSDRLDQMERKIEAIRPAFDFAQFEKRVTSTLIEPVDMLLNVHRDSVEREIAVVRRQITEIVRHIPDIDLDLLAPSAPPAIEDVAIPSRAAFDPVDRSQPMVAFDLSTRSPLVQPHGDVRWAGEQLGISLAGNGTIEFDALLGDGPDIVIRGSGARDASEFSAIVVSFNGRPMSGRFDVFADGRWAFTGGATGSPPAAMPARPTLGFNFLTGISRPSGRLRLGEISFLAPGRVPSRVEAEAPMAAIVNLGREGASSGWHPVEAEQRGGICWMGEIGDVSVNLHPSGSYRINIPEIRPLVAALMPKLQMFLDGEPITLEIAPIAHDHSAYSVQGVCNIRNGTDELHTLRISFPKDDVKSPMELGLNPDLRLLTIAVRCIMLAAVAS
ncbi:MAG TPA: hypothetical protein VMD76_13460 [Candidatus Sulfotelmatobacter sp.]|nr:hypothetical protein [Candidatus Sulfotelmatobacter sp.]